MTKIFFFTNTKLVKIYLVYELDKEPSNPTVKIVSLEQSNKQEM